MAIDVNDGLTFDLDATQVAPTRNDETYPSIRAKVVGDLATAKIRFHIDINIGDPLWPEPKQIELPRLLGRPALQVRGYSIELLLAEKIVENSNNVLCEGEPDAGLADVEPNSYIDTILATLQERFDGALEFRESCLTENPAILAHMSTTNVASGMELLRQAIDEEKLESFNNLAAKFDEKPIQLCRRN